MYYPSGKQKTMENHHFSVNQRTKSPIFYVTVMLPAVTFRTGIHIFFQEHTYYMELYNVPFYKKKR